MCNVLPLLLLLLLLLLGQAVPLRPSVRSVSVLQLCPEFPRLSHLQVSAPLSTKAQPASLSNPSYHPVQGKLHTRT